MEQIEVLSLALVRSLLANGDARRLRQEHRLSLGEVAIAIGVTPAVVAQWETGHARPRKDNALRYAQLLAGLVALDDAEEV